MEGVSQEDVSQECLGLQSVEPSAPHGEKCEPKGIHHRVNMDYREFCFLRQSSNHIWQMLTGLILLH